MVLLNSMGITVILTVEVVDSYIDLRFSPHSTAFLTDGIILQRYVELKGQLQRLMGMVKLRGSQHSKELKLYEITHEGLVMGTGLSGYEGPMPAARDDWAIQYSDGGMNERAEHDQRAQSS